MACKVTLGIFLGVTLSTLPLFAQNTNSGDIRGIVTDDSGAVIPGATVSLRDNDKGVIQTYVTDGAGLYETNSIIPDDYTITFTKQGFSTFVRGPISLGVETLTINGKLKVGATSETVLVNTDVPLLETETGEQSTTIQARELQDLPQVGASWENFVVLMPGASGTPTGGQSNVDPGQTASVNGNAVFYNVLGDGVTMSLPSNGNSYDYNFDTLSEVKIVTNGFSAEYENGGVIYNQISKSGSNRFHGDVFEEFQNNALNAAPYGFGQLTSVPILHYNYFGGSLGGPIVKDKLFFFGNFDYTQSYGSSTGFATVPTEAMIAGDFTGQPSIYDPTTQRLVNGVLQRTSFADEYHNGNKIPTGMIDGVAGALQAYFPKPNVANPTVVNGVTSNNYYYNLPVNSPNKAWFGRIDYNITPTNRLSVTDFQSYGNSTYLGIGACPMDCYVSSGGTITAQLTDVWTFSANTNNEFRLGATTQTNSYVSETLNKGYPAKVGLSLAKADEFPFINITGGCCFELQPGTDAQQKQLILQPSDVVTLIRGRHVLHFGGEFLNQNTNSTFWGNINSGTLTYSGVYTNSTTGDAATGVPYADFLLGQTQSWQAANTPAFYPRIKTVQLFAQDDIKLLPRLTVNLGVRWEGWTGMSDAHGNERSWDPTVVNPGIDPFGVPNTLGAMWYGTTRANGRTKTVAPVWNTFLPRVGFSWQAQEKTVLRGGLGLYGYNYSEGPVAYNEIGNAFGQSGNETDATNGIAPVVLLNNDGSSNFQGDAGASINSLYLNAPTGPAALNGQGVNFAYYHEPVQKIWQYNLALQREISSNMVLNLAYVGSHGFDQLFGIDLNQVPEDKLSPDDASGPTNARPYPNFQSIGGNRLVGISNYNAFQATIEKRMSAGLQFNFNYTWSKFLNETDACAWNCGTFTVQNMYVPSENYGPSDFDIRNMFKGRIVYVLPFGKGQRFLNSNSILEQTVGGWQTSVTVQYQSGNPFTVVTANNNSFSQSGAQYPNVVPGVSPWSGNSHTVGPNGNWFNEAAFSQPDAGTFGNNSRDNLYGPHLSNVNFSLGKSFPIWKTVFLLRADATNVLNHPSFGLPNTNFGPGQESTITSVTVGGRAMQLLGKLTF